MQAGRASVRRQTGIDWEADNPRSENRQYRKGSKKRTFPAKQIVESSREPMRKAIPYIAILRKLSRAGVQKSPVINRRTGDFSCLPTLQERVDFLMGIVNRPIRSATNMLFFVMYDIESDKVRYHIAKYLERKGCTRIQRSIFLADLDKSVYDEIKSDLAEVQSLYDNHDSIIVCPVSTDQIRAMQIIGEDISIDVIIRSRNTLFF